MALGAITSAPMFAGAELAKGVAGKPPVLRCALLGCGIRSSAHLNEAIGHNKQTLAAIVDPDPGARKKALAWLKIKRPEAKPPREFGDYRKFFETMGKDIDAVFIATPNHQHALPAMMAIKSHIPVYCEKPLCHTIGEARELRRLSLDNPSVATQMGNQGHCEEGYISLCEHLWSGAIGKITETHSWTDRANGGVGGRTITLPVPKGLEWDSWIGPAPYRDYHQNLHPHDWHEWYDFGNGSIGNMGCHILDGVYWALKLEHPDSVEMEQCRGGSDEQYPTGSRIRYDFPARGDQPALKVYWYEGFSQNAPGTMISNLQSVKGLERNRPGILKTLEEQFPDEDFASNGTVYVGEKGYAYTGTYGERFRILKNEKSPPVSKPVRTLERPKDIFTNFINAVQNGSSKTASPFEYGARLTEFTLLANLAQHAGIGKKVEWDGLAMKVRNMNHLNQWITIEKRKGWTC